MNENRSVVWTGTVQTRLLLHDRVAVVKFRCVCVRVCVRVRVCVLLMIKLIITFTRICGTRCHVKRNGLLVEGRKKGCFFFILRPPSMLGRRHATKPFANGPFPFINPPRVGCLWRRRGRLNFSKLTAYKTAFGRGTIPHLPTATPLPRQCPPLASATRASARADLFIVFPDRLAQTTVINRDVR